VESLNRGMLGPGESLKLRRLSPVLGGAGDSGKRAEAGDNLRDTGSKGVHLTLHDLD